MARLHVLWLRFLRYANAIDLASAQRVGNLEVIAWSRVRIARLDNEIDKLRIRQ